MYLKLYYDYDSVLNRLDYAWIDWINKSYGTFITTEDVLHWGWIKENYGDTATEFFKNPNHYSEDVIPVCPYAVKHFEMKHFLYKDRVKIITATWPETKEAKNGQIKKYFRVDDSQILNEYEKEKFTHDGILIDDNILNVYKHCKRNKKIGIVFDRNGKYGWSKFHNLSDDELIDEETMQYIKVAEDFDTITTILHNSNFC